MALRAVPPPEQETPWLDKAEVARLLCVSASTVMELARAGHLPSMELGGERPHRYFHKAEIARWIAEGRPSREPTNGLLDLLASGDYSVEIRVTKRPS